MRSLMADLFGDDEEFVEESEPTRAEIIEGPTRDVSGCIVTRLRRADGSEFTVSVPPGKMSGDEPEQIDDHNPPIPWITEG